MYIKRISFSDKRDRKAAELEIQLQKEAAAFSFCPNINEVTFTDTDCTISMDKIDTMCLADMYGANESDLPNQLWAEIHSIVNTLYEEAGIEYVDITPYNFIEHKNKVYIIDFGDAYYKGTKPRNWFHKDFLNMPYGWNPDFA